MSKKNNKPTGFFELIIDPSTFRGSSPEKRKKFAEIVHEVAAIEKEIVRIVYYDPYMASSLASSAKYLEIIEEVRLKFNSSKFVLIGCLSKGSFSNVNLSSPYIGKDYEGSNIHDRFMLFFDVNHELVNGISIGCSLNAVIGKNYYGINKLPFADSEEWYSKIKDISF